MHASHALRLALATAAAGFLAGCSSDSPGSDPNEPGPPPTLAEATTIDLAHPPQYASVTWPMDYSPQVVGSNNIPVDNPVTDGGALLGRVLFYDRELSYNRQLRCASCHRQQFGFADTARFSTGADGRSRTTTHAMRLVNARFYRPGKAFWDRRASTYETQASMPILATNELGFDASRGGMPALIERLQALPYYNELFRYAYGDSVVTEDRMQRALAQFVRSLVSVNSRFDKGWEYVYNAFTPDHDILRPFPGYTEEENRGKQLFIIAPASGGAGCASCHVPPTFALIGGALSNGLDSGQVAVFKAPSLKSMASVSRFMHDGRFKSLAEVVEHYNSGIKGGPMLDYRLHRPDNPAPLRLNLPAADKRALVAFLKTLTDESIATDPRFADPFRR